MLDEDDDDEEDEMDSSSSSGASGSGSGGLGGGKEVHDSINDIELDENHQGLNDDDDSDTIRTSQKRGSRVSKGPPSLAPINNAIGSSLPRADPLLMQVI